MKSNIFKLTLIALTFPCGVAGAELLASGDPSDLKKHQDETRTAQEPRYITGNDLVLAPPKVNAPLAGSATSFKFEETPVAEFANILLKDVLKVNYVLHPPLNGTVTLSTNNEVTPDQALILLEAALQANGLSLVRDTRGTYHIGKPEALKFLGPAVRQFVPGAPLPPGAGPIIVRLNFIGAAEMASILRPMLPPDALVRVDNLRNVLVLAGTRTQAEGWFELVETFDVDLMKGMSVGVFPLKYATTQEVEAAMRTLVPSASGQASGVQVGKPAAGSNAATTSSFIDSIPVAGAVRVLPIERINSVLVVTSRAAYLEEARRWIEKLDQPSGGDKELQLFIYQVKNVNARHLSSVLSGIFGDGKTTQASASSGVAPGLTPVVAGSSAQTFGKSPTTSQQGASANTGNPRGPGSSAASTPAAVMSLGDIRIMPDELNNSILVWGTKKDYEKIEATLRRLDLPLTQVLIEASIIEVTLTDALKYGVQWMFTDEVRGGFSGAGALSSLPGGIVGPSQAGFSYSLSRLGGVRAVLNALAGKTNLNVIASPSLMVLDNHTANISSGTQQPVNVGSSVGLGGVVTPNLQYKDTGVALAVTPSVNSGDMVTMDINQSVVDIGAPDTSNGTGTTGQPTFLQRQLSSKIAVRSGETIVLGGLIREKVTSSNSGVPGLHQIPLLGALFGTKERNLDRTELIVVITPRVIRSDQGLRDVSQELQQRMRGLQLFDSFSRPMLGRANDDERIKQQATQSETTKAQ